MGWLTHSPHPFYDLYMNWLYAWLLFQVLVKVTGIYTYLKVLSSFFSKQLKFSSRSMFISNSALFLFLQEMDLLLLLAHGTSFNTPKSIPFYTIWEAGLILSLHELGSSLKELAKIIFLMFIFLTFPRVLCSSCLRFLVNFNLLIQGTIRVWNEKCVQ